MDLVIVGLAITIGTSSAGNGRQWKAMDLVIFGLRTTTGRVGRQRDAMDLVTFELGITTGTRLGSNGR